MAHAWHLLLCLVFIRVRLYSTSLYVSGMLFRLYAQRYHRNAGPPGTWYEPARTEGAATYGNAY